MKSLKQLFIFAALSLSALTATAQNSETCPLYFAQSDLCANIEFTKGPFDGLESQFLLKVYGAKDMVLLDPAELKVDLWMYMGHHGGHGSAPVKVVKQDVGTYYVSEVYFIMPGRWNIRVWVNGEQRDMVLTVKR